MATSGFIPLRGDGHEKTVLDVILEKGLDDHWEEVVEFSAVVFKWPDNAWYGHAFSESWFCNIRESCCLGFGA
jgi:hypothetical protein